MILPYYFVIIVQLNVKVRVCKCARVWLTYVPYESSIDQFCSTYSTADLGVIIVIDRYIAKASDEFITMF